MNNTLKVNFILIAAGIGLSMALFGVNGLVSPSTGKSTVKKEVSIQNPLFILRALDELHPELNREEVEAVFASRLARSKKHFAEPLAKIVMQSSKKYGLSPSMVLALIDAESSFHFYSHSNKGAVGMMQLLPRTARYIARREHIRYRGVRDLRDPKVNLKLGIAYLAYLKNKFPDSIQYVAAYNMGPTAMSRELASEDGFQLGALEPYVTKIHREASRLKRSRTTLQEVVMN